MAESSDDDSQISGASDNDDQVVPANVLYNLEHITVVTAELPGPDDIVTDLDDPEPICEHERLGEVRILQLSDKDGQGQYFTAQSGTMGHVLIKYLDGAYCTHLLDTYRDARLPDETIGNHAWAERERARPREIQFADTLTHPNISQVLAIICSTERIEDIKALIMKGASCGVLENHARRHQLSDLEVKSYGKQLASALEYCHKKRVMHRDVRPRNIYVHDGGSTVKLGNFGFARKGGHKLVTAGRGEELWYKAPEVISPNPLTEYSYPVDVYSFGLVLWSISHSGKRPFKDENVSITDHANFKEYLQEEGERGEAVHRPTIRSDLDGNLAGLIRRCWITNPRRRPTMANVEAGLQ